jgi:hypothetical protein
VKTYSSSFCPAAQKTLDALLGFNPPWRLSGRAALWWLTIETGFVEKLGLVWRGRDTLGTLPGAICDRLGAVGLVPAHLYGHPRGLWLGVSDARSTCALQLMAEPLAPLAPASQLRLHGHFFYVESWRDIFLTILCSFCKKPNPEDAMDLHLLLRRGTPLQQGFQDALRRNPDFDPRQLLAIAHIDIQDLPEETREDFRRFREELVFRIMAYIEAHENGEV